TYCMMRTADKGQTTKVVKRAQSLRNKPHRRNRSPTLRTKSAYARTVSRAKLRCSQQLLSSGSQAAPIWMKICQGRLKIHQILTSGLLDRALKPMRAKSEIKTVSNTATPTNK